MDTKPFSLQAPESIAKEYGGNKQAIAKAAQMGMLDPTAAVLAGMFIDRMRNAATQEQAPNQTVAQETFAARPQMGAPGQAMPQAQMGVPSESAPVAGLAALPVDEQMFDESAYAGGGIVAFQSGGPTVGGEFGNINPMIQSGIAAARSYDEDIAKKRLLSRQVVQKFAGDPTKRDVINRVNQFSVPELETLLASVAPAPINLAANLPVSDAPMFGAPMAAPVVGAGDLRRLEAAAGDPYVTGRGLTPEQSEASIISDRPPAPAAAPVGLNIADIIRDTKRFADELVPAPSAVVPTPEQASQQTEESLRLAGFDPELFKKQREQLDTEKASLAEDRKTAQNMRILEAGLGIMAGTSANAFENIGKGATPAVQGLAKDIKELKSAERAFTKAQMDLDTKQNDFALGKAKMNQSVVDRAQDRRDKQEDRVYNARAKIGGVFLDAKLKEQLIKETGGKATDLDKEWARYSAEEIAAGRTPTFSGFQVARAGTRAQLTYKDALEIAAKADPYASPEELDAKARQLLSGQQRFMGGSGSSQFTEGQEAKDKTGKPIVYRNGQWVYK